MRLRRTTALSARQLAATPLVVSPPGTSTRMLLEQALAQAGATPRVAVDTAAREAIVPLVLAGAGAALLPAPLAREAQRRGATVSNAGPQNHPHRRARTPPRHPLACGQHVSRARRASHLSRTWPGITHDVTRRRTRHPDPANSDPALDRGERDRSWQTEHRRDPEVQPHPKHVIVLLMLPDCLRRWAGRHLRPTHAPARWPSLS